MAKKKLLSEQVVVVTPQFDRARQEMGLQPQPLPPVYQPEPACSLGQASPWVPWSYEWGAEVRFLLTKRRYKWHCWS